MIGPKNGIIFSSAHTSDIVTAFGIPIINKIIVQMKNKTVTCMSNPMKYLDNKFLIESIDFSTLKMFLSAIKTMTIFSNKPLSFKKKNDIKMTENTSKTDSNQKILKELMYDDGQPLYEDEEDQKELLKES